MAKWAFMCLCAVKNKLANFTRKNTTKVIIYPPAYFWSESKVDLMNLHVPSAEQTAVPSVAERCPSHVYYAIGLWHVTRASDCRLLWGRSEFIGATYCHPEMFTTVRRTEESRSERARDGRKTDATSALRRSALSCCSSRASSVTFIGAKFERPVS